MNTNKSFVSEDELIALADNMASSAASFSAHGYDEFIRARDLFKSTVHQFFEIETIPAAEIDVVALQQTHLKD